jgi:uncharacterized repeat protein (TIGR01451 family)
VALDGAATAAGSAIACTFTNTKLPTVTLTKISNGGVGGFTFTGTNGWTSQTITTVTSGTGVTGATQTLTAAATATTITETIPAGYAVTAITCSGLGSGGTATPNLAGGSVALDAAATAAGSAIACTFTNTKLPTVTLTKISTGFTGAFNYSGTNGFGSDTITTLTAGSPVTGATKTLTAASTATVISETMSTSFIMTAASCSGLGSGGTATPNLATGSISLNAAATAPGAAITCSITNAAAVPSVAVSKSASPTTVAAAGAVIGYTITVNNTGNVPVSSIAVTDPRGPATCTTSGTSTIATLAVGGSETCSVSYTATQSDFDTNGGGDGDIDNTATASGTYASAPVTANGSTQVTVTQNPHLTILKTASPVTPAKVGDVITYTYVVTNDGNLTIDGVTVNDTHNGYGTPPVPGSETLSNDAAPLLDSTDAASNNSWDHLAPGDSVTFTSTYTVTQSDLDLLQ